jgi:hypothetical protein
VRFEEFYTERMRVVREVTDPAALATEVARLRDLTETVTDDPEKARRYVEATERLLEELARLRSEVVHRAFAAMLRARRPPPGTPEQQRASVEAGIGEVARIAATAQNEGERHAALELNEVLLRELERLGRRP